MSNPLFTAELAIYAILSLPVIFTFFRHWPSGILGWFYAFAFCSLRVVGSALAMQASSLSTGSLISSIGLSPLILAAASVLHEARIFRIDLNKTLEWSLVAAIHVLVATGIALLAVGATALNSPHPQTSDTTNVSVGIAILTAAYMALVVWTVCSYLQRQRTQGATAYQNGTMLLNAVSFALVFIGIRVLYSLVALTTRKPYLNPVTGTMTIRVVLSFLPELIAMLALISAGLRTHGVSRASKNNDNVRQTRRRETKY